MDEYDFNLDLETWGLTDKQTEIRRFEPFLPAAQIAASNALFGYEGDQYYYDVDIRRHFGLDKYTTDTIPYWKTETVEAMNAFRLKPNYSRGAGECVSLSTLYAAAAFIVCGVPLDDLFMVLTPLHSQNFIDLGDGVLTNNRRLVTKAMWFTGHHRPARLRPTQQASGRIPDGRSEPPELHQLPPHTPRVSAVLPGLPRLPRHSPVREGRGPVCL